MLRSCCKESRRLKTCVRNSFSTRSASSFLSPATPSTLKDNYRRAQSLPTRVRSKPLKSWRQGSSRHASSLPPVGGTARFICGVTQTIQRNPSDRETSREYPLKKYLASLPTFRYYHFDPSPPRKVKMVNHRVELTDEEREIFQLLLECCVHFNLKTTMRAAGGWVRDKLLGRCSDDIDIALDDMLGKEFAEKVNEYLAIRGEETHKIGLILTNPEQSKHLETARVRIRDTWIDLVNLRSETYASDSRIPEMAFGTPEEDAYRRDLTINSMFYNINTSLIEDFTGTGLLDLQEQVIRTPLAPRETFLDDPLRVLRAIRFSARFGFELEVALVEAAASDEVRDALRDKVSRERVGAELEGMLKSAAPVFAIQQLVRLRHFATVFPVPPNCSLPAGIDPAPACLAAMSTVGDVLTALPPEWLSDEERRLCLLAGLLLPLRDCTVTLKKGKEGPLAAYIIKESLKIRAKDADLVAGLHACAEQFAGIAGALHLEGAPELPEDFPEEPRTGRTDGFPPEQCVAVGRIMGSVKQAWRVCLPLAAIMASPCATSLMVEAAAVEGPREAAARGGAKVLDHLSLGDRCEAQRKRRANLCHEIETVVRSMGLAEGWSIKPLLNGKEVQAALGLERAGPQIGKATAALLEWQYAHPAASQDEARAWIAANQAELLLSK